LREALSANGREKAPRAIPYLQEECEMARGILKVSFTGLIAGNRP